MTRRALLALAAVGMAVLTACTGVPAASSPQVVNPVGAAQSSGPPVITPQPNADPRTMVTDFLTASATDDVRHQAARGFLTSDAAQRWADATVTVVDSLRVGNFVDGAVTVTGRPIGSVSASGIYKPVLQGNGSGGTPNSFSFGMKQVNGQWRIDTLQAGVVLAYADFQRVYQQRALYFFDLAERRIVPDPRYTALSDPARLAGWLMGQLAAGPRPELQSGVTTELPAQIDPSRVTVTLGSPIRVELPGASQLDMATRNRLAAQVAVTLQQVSSGSDITIMDSGRPVSVPQARGTVFAVADFNAIVNPPSPTPSVFYIRDGAVVDQLGAPLPGALGSGRYDLGAVALSSVGSTDLRVAGTSGAGANARLLVGTRDSGLRSTAVRGRLSRPAWFPGQDEVWVGDGASVLRVGLDGKAHAVAVTGSTGSLSGQVTALRFSPEGMRVAMVVKAADNIAQVWLGSVVRSPDSSQVRVDNLEAISPQGVGVVDVAWNDSLKLFTIGRDLATGDPSIYEVQVDGSRWAARGIDNLPIPDSITVAEDQEAWVSAGGTVWAQQATGWTSRGRASAFCTNPVYLE